MLIEDTETFALNFEALRLVEFRGSMNNFNFFEKLCVLFNNAFEIHFIKKH